MARTARQPILDPGPTMRTGLSVAAGAVAASFVVGLAMWGAGESTVAVACLAGAAFASIALAGILLARDRHEARGRAETSEQNLKLAEQLISAEQDERRRLSLMLHDGPLQELSGVALMHDAALAALTEGRHDDALEILRGALERERSTIQTMRDLSFAIEPVILRDYGFEASVRAVADQMERDGTTSVEIDVAAGELLSEKMQVALYQTVREALAQAARRSPSSVRVLVERNRDKSFVLEVRDDGHRERRRRNVEAVEERARMLQGAVALDSTDTGTTLLVTLPAFVVDPIHDESAQLVSAA